MPLFDLADKYPHLTHNHKEEQTDAHAASEAPLMTVSLRGRKVGGVVFSRVTTSPLYFSTRRHIRMFDGEPIGVLNRATTFRLTSNHNLYE